MPVQNKKRGVWRLVLGALFALLAVVSLLQGIDNKQEVLAALQTADQTREQLQQLQGAVEQLQDRVEQEGQRTQALRQALVADQTANADYTELHDEVAAEPTTETA